MISLLTLIFTLSAIFNENYYNETASTNNKIFNLEDFKKTTNKIKIDYILVFNKANKIEIYFYGFKRESFKKIEPYFIVGIFVGDEEKVTLKSNIVIKASEDNKQDKSLFLCLSIERINQINKNERIYFSVEEVKTNVSYNNMEVNNTVNEPTLYFTKNDYIKKVGEKEFIKGSDPDFNTENGINNKNDYGISSNYSYIFIGISLIITVVLIPYSLFFAINRFFN